MSVAVVMKINEGLLKSIADGQHLIAFTLFFRIGTLRV